MPIGFALASVSRHRSRRQQPPLSIRRSRRRWWLPYRPTAQSLLSGHLQYL